MITAPIFIVDDDSDDRMLIKDAWEELKFENSLVFFNTGKELLAHLRTHSLAPLIILSEVGLPVTNGFELRKSIKDDDSIKYKSIPFIFWSQRPSNEQIKTAYDLSSHGFFVKGETIEEIKNFLKILMEYWRISQIPE